jgi:membrane protein YdbS with pleckstrin-like domain
MIGDQAVLRASQWCYKGVWGFITKWLYVPESPPELVGAHDSHIRAFRPAEGYLRYRKLFFWIGLVLVDVVLFIAWLALLVNVPIAGILLAPLFWFVIIVPDILVYIGIHLRYDTTWYVLSDRTLRIRRGIWVINEVTITYENIQNVTIRQGPIQRLFGISDVLVHTAGGGGSVGPHGEQNLSGHLGLLEGIDNPAEVREVIMAKWRAAKSAGLGDEARQVAFKPIDGSASMPQPATSFRPGSVELQVLQQIRDLAVRLAAS